MTSIWKPMARTLSARWVRRGTLVVLAALSACGIALPAARAQDPPPVFSSGVDMVRVDVLVTRGGRAVANLTVADFEVTDSGVRQQVELVSFDEVPVNVVIALDVSSSLTPQRLSQLQAGCSSLAAVLKNDDQAALVTFAEAVVLTAPPTARLDAVRRAIGTVRPADHQRPTALVDAVFASVLAAESEPGRSLVVVFSDGVDTGSWLRPPAVLEIARRSDAVVYAVTAEHEGRDSFLANLVEATGGAMTRLESSDDLGAVFLRILEEFRHRYLVSYRPRGVSLGGWHDLSVRVNARGAKVTSRSGYWSGR